MKNLNLQKDIIYSIYVRNHTEEGTFKAIEKDLDRIRDLGTDIIWFMPIHPIGEEGKKGKMGCPYANKDYRTINPEYGNITDFIHIVDEIHARGMKCIIDVVYNHTSPDSTLVKEHPEFFFYRDGKRANKVGDWSDVRDLDYTNKDLWDYQIESLVYWASIVDGFRCDVASFVPLDFWLEARKEVEKVNPDCIWLAESVHKSFGQMARMHGLYSCKDVDLFKAFDMEYEYDIREAFESYLTNKSPLSHYIDALNTHETVYPDDYNKCRCLENHDTKRFVNYVQDELSYNNFTAFLYFNKGCTLLYAGQEYKNDFTPTLFDKEVIVRNENSNISSMLKNLARIKKEVIDVDDLYQAIPYDELDIVVMTRLNKQYKKIGIFSLKGKKGSVKVELKDGIYKNEIDQSDVTVLNSNITMDGNPIIIRTENE